MPLDPYSLCPGGREKKIRFCCPDMVKEIDQIERLLESNQGEACLSFIESLEKNHPGCACLTAAKLSVFRTQNRWKEALDLAKIFAEREPENPVAASEYGLALAVTGHFKDSLSVLIDGFERAKEGTAHSSLINATLQVGTILLSRGLIPPVVAIANRLRMFPSVQEPANALLFRVSSEIHIPLLLRDMVFDPVCPDDFPGKTDYEDAVELITMMQWKKALAKMESLLPLVDQWPKLWRNIAAVRAWLLENEAARDAMQAFAVMPGVPEKTSVTLEDAVDAMATGIYLSPEGLGDLTEVQTLEYPVTDAEKVQELLLSSPLFYSISPTEAMIPNQASSENSPPPRAAFAILDRPFPEPGAELTLDSVTTQQCVAALFGKETDREARLVIVDAVANERTALEDRLKDVLGELIQEPQNIRTLGKVSQTQLMIHHRYSYPRDREMDFEAIKKFEDEYFAVHFPDRWSTLPLGFLEGKTPADAAKDPAYQVRLLAAIQFFAFWLSEDVALEISNKIRSRFGLPTLDSIPVPDASEGTEIELLGVLDEQPIWRWSRFEVEKLPTAVLIEGLQIVAVMKEMMATKRFAEELLGRPMKSMPVESRAVAFNSLISITSGAMQAEDALLWVERAKNEAAELGITDAGWCLHEIPIRLSLKQYDKVQEVVGYLVQNFGHDPKVMQGLQRLFMEMGLINPDGTLVEKFVKEPTSAPQPSLWTPDGGTADMTVTGSLPSNSAAPSKLWTPD